MTLPTPYSRTFSFTGAQAANPTAPLPGIHVDTELDQIANSLAAVLNYFAASFNTDGTLKTGSVTADKLDPALLARITTLEAAVRNQGVALLTLLFASLPTSPVGLAVGQPWLNGGVLCFVTQP